MSDITQKSPSFNDLTLLKLAREIAMDISPIEKILETHTINAESWDEIQASSTFRGYLRNALEEWQSATNTAERVRLKSLAFVEEALPEFFARAHDAGEALQHKIKTLEVVARFAGIGGQVDSAVSAEKFSVTINLGADHQVKIEKDVTPQVTIEGEVQ